MKVLLLSVCLFLPLLASAAPTSQRSYDRKERDLLYCETNKWSAVALKEVTVVTDGKEYASYSLDVQHGDRDRASVGAYTESVAPVFFTENAKSVSFKNSNDGFELFAEFTGSQPLQISAVKLVGRKSGNANDMIVTLEEAKPVTNDPTLLPSSSSYDFFLGRWNQLIMDSKANVLDQGQPLVCHLIK